MKKVVILFFVVIGTFMILLGLSLNHGVTGQSLLEKIANQYNYREEKAKDTSRAVASEEGLSITDQGRTYFYQYEDGILSTKAMINNEEASKIFVKLVNAISTYNSGSVEIEDIEELSNYTLQDGVERKALLNEETRKVKTSLRLNGSLLLSLPLTEDDFIPHDIDLRGSATFSMERGDYYLQKSGVPQNLTVYLGEKNRISKGLYTSLVNLIRYIYGDEVGQVFETQYPKLTTGTVGNIQITVNPVMDKETKERFKEYQMVLVKVVG